MLLTIKKIRSSVASWLRMHVGKLSMLQFAAIIVLLFAVVYIATSFRNEEKDVYVEMIFENQGWTDNYLPPEYWKVESLHEGDTAYNSFGYEYAQIVALDKIYYEGGTRKYVRALFKVKADFNKKTKIYNLNGNPVLVGKQLLIQISNTEFKGTIISVFTDIEKRFNDYKKANLVIRVKYYDLKPWHAEEVSKLVVEKEDGDVIARVLSAEVLPAEKTTQTDSGALVLSKDPINKDVIADIHIPNALCLDVCFYDRRYALLVGGDFWTDSDKTWVGYGSIMDIKINYE